MATFTFEMGSVISGLGPRVPAATASLLSAHDTSGSRASDGFVEHWESSCAVVGAAVVEIYFQEQRPIRSDMHR